MQLNDILFDRAKLSHGAEQPNRNSQPSPATDFSEVFQRVSNNLAPNSDAASAERSQARLSPREEYVELLPNLGGVDFGPPVEQFDLGVELQRLARIELKVEAMEQAGEIDKALDAFIGIHGLKDKLSRAEKQELRGRFVELTKAVLLEDEWQNAYLGAMKKRIDVSMEGLREFLLGDEGEPRFVEANQELPLGDPDLTSFVRDARWRNFSPPDFTVMAKADQMLLEAKRARELGRS